MLFRSLLDNAIKFSQEDSIIEIELKHDNQHIIFTIKDFGVGISEADLKRIFDKFYQGDTSRKSYGNGLGLSLVDRIITLHKGQLSVKSEVDKGTEVFIRLPQDSSSY